MEANTRTTGCATPSAPPSWNVRAIGSSDSGTMTSFRISKAFCSVSSRHSTLTPALSLEGRGRMRSSDMTERAVYTVSELTRLIKAELEERFPAVWVEGEVSNLRTPSSGHAYFTLKDDGAQLRCVLFRGRGRRVPFQLEDGLQVLAFGGLDVYAARGEYQFVVELMEPKGLGALQLAFEQLKRKLEAEGLFDAARKRPLPAYPRTIGIVTSRTGAAIRDMLHIIGRRFGGVRLLIAAVRVQGEEAPGEIVEALATLHQVPE